VTPFDTRILPAEPLAAVGVSIPPWPGEDEAVVEGAWESSAFD
jgi:mannose-6-phosphate isomerase-like protein (cupin superfamily)